MMLTQLSFILEAIQKLGAFLIPVMPQQSVSVSKIVPVVTLVRYPIVRVCEIMHVEGGG